MQDRSRAVPSGEHSVEERSDDPGLSDAARASEPEVRPSGIAHLSRTARAIKRMLDLVVGSIALLVSLPLWPVIAGVIAVTSRGPVLYRQERVGRAGVPFEIIKFRTMRDGTHTEVISSEDEFSKYAANGFKLSDDDPRITWIGRLLRRTSLDELPQLINVLRGDMALVGIRPLIAIELASRNPLDRSYYKAFRPGVTGLWQVKGRSSFDAEEREALDRRYVENWSIGLDLRLLAATPMAALRFATKSLRDHS